MRALEIFRCISWTTFASAVLLSNIGCRPTRTVTIVDEENQYAHHVLRVGEVLTWQSTADNVPFVIHWTYKVCKEGDDVRISSVPNHDGLQTATCTVRIPVPPGGFVYYGIEPQAVTPTLPAGDTVRPATRPRDGDGNVVPCPGCDAFENEDTVSNSAIRGAAGHPPGSIRPKSMVTVGVQCYANPSTGLHFFLDPQHTSSGSSVKWEFASGLTPTAPIKFSPTGPTCQQNSDGTYTCGPFTSPTTTYEMTINSCSTTAATGTILVP